MGVIYTDTGVSINFGGTFNPTQGNLHTKNNITFGTSTPVPAIINFGTNGFYLEHNGFGWTHYTEDSTYKVTSANGTIQFNISPVGTANPPVILFTRGASTIGRMDQNGNLLIAGSIGTGIAF